MKTSIAKTLENFLLICVNLPVYLTIFYLITKVQIYYVLKYQSHCITITI